MAKDYLNVIERALMMAISDKINSVTGSGENVYVHGQFPETEDMKFPLVVVQMTASGFEEKYFGDAITFGGSSTTGEAYGVAYTIHLITDRETNFTVSSVPYKQRRLLNWLMLNVANCIMEIDWSVYEEEELEVLERHLAGWRDIGYVSDLQWYGATADFNLFFLNKRG